jgi:hypothetical protein
MSPRAGIVAKAASSSISYAQISVPARMDAEKFYAFTACLPKNAVCHQVGIASQNDIRVIHDVIAHSPPVTFRKLYASPVCPLSNSSQRRQHIAFHACFY